MPKPYIPNRATGGVFNGKLYCGDALNAILSKSDNVNHPSHYGGADNQYEAIKVIDAWELGFDLGNTIKYISRAGKKEGNSEIQDLEKAMFYLEHRIEKLKEGGGNANP